MFTKSVISRNHQRLKRRFLSHRRLNFILLTLIIFAALTWLTYQLIVTTILKKPYLDTIQTSITNFIDPTSALAQTQNLTNILILGKGGAVHETPNLTDSILLVSLNHQTKQILVLSLPRDIWIPSLRAKLNTAYHYGQLRQDGGGIILAKSAVSEVTDLPIHYAAVLDFTGFTNAINLLGGIDIDVKREFDDYKYPIPGMENAEEEENRYEHLHFDAGLQHMDGETALKYVRSRNSEGPEGTDLARSERQKKVLVAVKNKLLSTQLLLNQSKLGQLQNILGQSLETDIDQTLYSAFARIAIDLPSYNLQSQTIPTYLPAEKGNVASESALLINPEISRQHDYQWVLTPTTGNFQDIHAYIQCLIERETNCH